VKLVTLVRQAAAFLAVETKPSVVMVGIVAAEGVPRIPNAEEIES